MIGVKDEIEQKIIDYLYNNNFRIDGRLVLASSLDALFPVGERTLRRYVEHLHDKHVVVFGYRIEDEKYEELKKLEHKVKTGDPESIKIVDGIKTYFAHIPRYIGLNDSEIFYVHNNYRVDVIQENGKKLAKVREPLLITEDDLVEALKPEIFARVA